MSTPSRYIHKAAVTYTALSGYYLVVHSKQGTDKVLAIPIEKAKAKEAIVSLGLKRDLDRHPDGRIYMVHWS